MLNLASGIDTRPYRLPLSAALRWIDVDFPDVVAYTQAQLASARPGCALEYTGVDLTDSANGARYFSARARGARYS